MDVTIPGIIMGGLSCAAFGTLIGMTLSDFFYRGLRQKLQDKEHEAQRRVEFARKTGFDDGVDSALFSIEQNIIDQTKKLEARRNERLGIKKSTADVQHT